MLCYGDKRIFNTKTRSKLVFYYGSKTGIFLDGGGGVPPFGFYSPHFTKFHSQIPPSFEKNPPYFEKYENLGGCSLSTQKGEEYPCKDMIL